MASKIPVKILKAARAKIDSPERWTQGASARDADGEAVRSRDPKAVCWCSLGAIQAVSKGRSEVQKAAARDLLNLVVDAIAPFNDGHTHAEVLAMFDAAIELAAQDPAP